MKWLLLIFPALLFADVKTLYSSLDPASISKQLAFYQLYPESDQGKQALSRAWQLLGASSENIHSIPNLDLQPMIALVNKQPLSDPPELSDETLQMIDRLSANFGNRKLKGKNARDIETVKALTVDEIDLARSLFLYQFDDLRKLRQYEAAIDLMALQIASHLKPDATDEEKVFAINDFIFHEMRYRFPPHSLWTDDVDLYTFLPAVMDSRKGVCLGVSILYLSLAQRLELPLEIITPPGHIYLRYRKNATDVINIETTARGIHVPSEHYLSIHTKSLQTRNIKEVIGLAFVNQAATYLTKENYTLAIETYEKALPYLPDDPLLKTLLSYSYLFAGDLKQGRALLKTVENVAYDGSLKPETLPQDFLRGRCDVECIKTVFKHVDENRESVLEKQKRLQDHLKKYPKFRDGYFHLAVTHFQLNQHEHALKALEKLHKLDPTKPTVEYYLAELKLMRLRPLESWKHFENAQKLLRDHDHNPPCMKTLLKNLTYIYPNTGHKKSAT